MTDTNETTDPTAAFCLPNGELAAKEQGLDVVGANWRGFYAPGKMSDEAYNFWVKSVGTVYDSKEWKDIMAKNGIAPLGLRGAEFQKFVKESVDEIQGLSREIGIIK